MASVRPGTRRKRFTGSTAVQYVIACLWGAIVLFPLLDLLVLSVKTLPEIVSHPFQWPTHIHWSNYVVAWTQGDIGRLLLNTAVVAIGSVVVVVSLSSAAAYVLGRFAFRGNQAIYLMFLSGLALPIQLLAVPLFVLIRQLGLLDNPLSLVLVYGSSGLSFSVFLLTSFVRSVPKELEEAAFMEGATPFQVYLRVVMPIMRPVLATVALFNFVGAWNGFFFPLVLLTSPARMTVSVGVLSFVGVYSTQWNYLVPALIMVMLPMVLVFSLASRQFIRGLTAGALKV